MDTKLRDSPPVVTLVDLTLPDGQEFRVCDSGAGDLHGYTAVPMALHSRDLSVPRVRMPLYPGGMETRAQGRIRVLVPGDGIDDAVELYAGRVILCR